MVAPSSSRGRHAILLALILASCLPPATLAAAATRCSHGSQDAEEDCFATVRAIFPSTREDFDAFPARVAQLFRSCLAGALAEASTRRSECSGSCTVDKDTATAAPHADDVSLLLGGLQSLAWARDNLIKQSLFLNVTTTVTPKLYRQWSAEMVEQPLASSAPPPLLYHPTILLEAYNAGAVGLPFRIEAIAVLKQNSAFRAALLKSAIRACDREAIDSIARIAGGAASYQREQEPKGGRSEETVIHRLFETFSQICERTAANKWGTPPAHMHVPDAGATDQDAYIFELSGVSIPKCADILANVPVDKSSSVLTHTLRENVPAILTHYPQNSLQELKQYLGSVASLATTLKGESVMVASIPYGDVFGLDAGYATLDEYMSYVGNTFSPMVDTSTTNMSSCLNLLQDGSVGKRRQRLEPSPFYVFDHEILDLVNASHLALPPRPMLDELSQCTREGAGSSEPSSWGKCAASTSTMADLIHQFFLGPKCSGSPLHVHQTAMNVLLKGSKYWWLKPPSRKVYTKEHPLLMAREAQQQSSSSSFATHGLAVADISSFGDPTCVQEEGDILLVPRGWAHATLNRELVIGVATELPRS